MGSFALPRATRLDTTTRFKAELLMDRSFNNHSSLWFLYVSP
jgi:hypothetical protein